MSKVISMSEASNSDMMINVLVFINKSMEPNNLKFSPYIMLRIMNWYVSIMHPNWNKYVFKVWKIKNKLEKGQNLVNSSLTINEGWPWPLKLTFLLRSFELIFALWIHSCIWAFLMTPFFIRLSLGCFRALASKLKLVSILST